MHKIKITKLSGAVLSTLLIGGTIAAILFNANYLIPQTATKEDTSINSLDTISDSTTLYNFAQTQSTSIDNNDGKTTENYDITNHMQDVLSFKYDKNLYYAMCNSNGDLILYNSDFNEINEFLLNDLIYSTTSHEEAKPKLIEDVIPSSDGHYLYIAVLFSDATVNERGDVIYKMNVGSNHGISQKLYTMDWGHSTYALGIIPATAGDLLIWFDEVLATNNNVSAWNTPSDLDYTIINAADGTKKSRSSIKSGALINEGYNPGAIMQDIYIVGLGKDSLGVERYQLYSYLRSRDTLTYVDQSWTNGAVFKLDSNNKIVLDNTKNTTHNSTDMHASNKTTYQNVDAGFITNQYVAKEEKPAAIATSLYSWGGKDTNVYLTTNESDSIRIDQDPTKITNNGEAIYENDISLDGTVEYWLSNTNAQTTTKQENKVANSGGYNISLTNSIDRKFYLPQTNSTIAAFSWADVDKKKMLLFDSNNMVSQFDTTTKSFSLKKGIAYISNDYLASASADPSIKAILKKSPSQITDKDLQKLVQQKVTAPSKITIERIPDNDTGTLKIDVTISNSGGTSFHDMHTFTGFRKGAVALDYTVIYIIAGSIGGAILLFLIISISVYKVKKKTTTRRGKKQKQPKMAKQPKMPKQHKVKKKASKRRR